ncbi:MAG UNVERIFIED_CONTAM: hypothetical protein LVR18_11910 [Planctomycetaceae bacterium]
MPPSSSALTVFLAETSDDLIPQRRQVQQYLEDNQYRVLARLQSGGNAGGLASAGRGSAAAVGCLRAAAGTVPGT